MTMSHAETRTQALWWADSVMLATLFVMQKYLTEVWGLGFTTAATLLNIWGGIHRILPFFFLFVADTFLGNFWMLLLSNMFNLAGVGLMTWITGAGYRCLKKQGVAGECVGYKEKSVVITAMALLAIGRAALFASTKPFIQEQTGGSSHKYSSWKAQISDTVTALSPTLSFLCFLFFLGVPAATFLAFPHIEKSYFLFGVSAFCTLFAFFVFLGGLGEYLRPLRRAEGSPVTDIVRVFVAAAFKRSLPSPKLDDQQNLHLTTEGHEEFKKLTETRFQSSLHKAAIKLEDENVGNKKKRSWRLSSVTEVESAKVMIRMVPMYVGYLMSGVVASIADTYLIEQATHMNYNLGTWKPPLQLLHLVFLLFKYLMEEFSRQVGEDDDQKQDIIDVVNTGIFTTVWSVVCCTVAAAIERRRVHSMRGHYPLVDDNEGRAPMSAYWLLFEVVFLGFVKACLGHSLSGFHKKEGPRSMERYYDCMGEGVVGMGYMCGAFSVYVVGKMSQTGGGKGWFQHSLNRSRLDRYYWVLAALNFFFVLFQNIYTYKTKAMLGYATAAEAKRATSNNLMALHYIPLTEQNIEIDNNFE